MKAKVVLAAVKGDRTEAPLAGSSTYQTEKHPVTPGEKARGYYVAAIALTENADPVRPQIAHARAFVSRPEEREQGNGTLNADAPTQLGTYGFNNMLHGSSQLARSRASSTRYDRGANG